MTSLTNLPSELLSMIPKALEDDSHLQLQVAVVLRSICQHTRNSIERWFQKHYIETANLSFSNSTSQRTVPPSKVRTIVVSGDIIDGWDQETMGQYPLQVDMILARIPNLETIKIIPPEYTLALSEVDKDVKVERWVHLVRRVLHRLENPAGVRTIQIGNPFSAEEDMYDPSLPVTSIDPVFYMNLSSLTSLHLDITASASSFDQGKLHQYTFFFSSC
jgi:hypothetical protein